MNANPVHEAARIIETLCLLRQALSEAHSIIEDLSSRLHELEGVTPIKAITWMQDNHAARPNPSFTVPEYFAMTYQKQQ